MCVYAFTSSLCNFRTHLAGNRNRYIIDRIDWVLPFSLLSGKPNLTQVAPRAKILAKSFDFLNFYLADRKIKHTFWYTNWHWDITNFSYFSAMVYFWKGQWLSFLFIAPRELDNGYCSTFYSIWTYESMNVLLVLLFFSFICILL